MQIEEEGEDCAVERLKVEEHIMQIDFWCDCDNGIDRYEEEDCADGRFWKDDGFDCDVIDMQIEEVGDD